MNTIGYNIKITFFGESHGTHMGVTIDGLKSGLALDESLIRFNLTKRRPKKDISTTRIEKDQYQIISGYVNGYTTGGALTVLIPNTNKHSKDYQSLTDTPRPSQADYPARVKYRGFNDMRGSGFFSGRLTALWVVVGSIAQQLLQAQGIIVSSHILSIKDVLDDTFNKTSTEEEMLVELLNKDFPVLNETSKKRMLNVIRAAKDDYDAVGGIIESKAINVPVGLGEPYFLSFESYLSNLLFSIPAIKGIEFGKGFDITKHYSSEVNDPYTMVDDRVKTTKNNNGGILGGLTTGMPIIVRTAVKPTPSIFKPQKTVNLKTNKDTTLTIEGRHDPQIVSRVVHVINAVMNFAIYDLLQFHKEKE